jgi:hypothetical protein
MERWALVQIVWDDTGAVSVSVLEVTEAHEAAPEARMRRLAGEKNAALGLPNGLPGRVQFQAKRVGQVLG